MSLSVLWLARTLPTPLDAGDRVYTGYLADALGKAGAAIDYIGHKLPEARDDDLGKLSHVAAWHAVEGGLNPALPALLSSKPLVGARHATAAYRATLQRQLAAQAYDAIVIDQYGMSWVLDALKQVSNHPLIVHIGHDFETKVLADIAAEYRGNPLRKIALRLNARKAGNAERAIIAATDLLVTLTREDAEEFQHLDPGLPAVVASPAFTGQVTPQRAITADTPRRIAIVGSYHWTAKQMNLAAFLKEADPLFAASGIELAIIGKGPADFSQQWGLGLKATRFINFVEDLGAALGDCRMGLSVERTGGGFKLKLLDYIFNGRPVAAIESGLAGYADAIRSYFLIRQDARSLAQAITEIIDDVPQLNTMQAGAYEIGSALFSWDRNGAALYDAMIAHKGRKSAS